MSKKAELPSPTLEDRIRWLLSYDHHISVDNECDMGDHWWCSCGESGLDDTASHLAKFIVMEIESGDTLHQ